MGIDALVLMRYFLSPDRHHKDLLCPLCYGLARSWLGLLETSLESPPRRINNMGRIFYGNEDCVHKYEVSPEL